MKEPWKKTCNGKVIITLNDEKTTPTEVEVPVDLNWTNRSDKRCSAPKAIILVGVALVLGLTIVTLFKVQNLVYSTSYINWRMQELESTVSDSNDDVKLIKYKLSLEDEEMSRARAEPLIASASYSKNADIDSQDLKLSESQNGKQTRANAISFETAEPKNSKEAEVQASGKNLETMESDPKPETKNDKKESEETELNDGRDHPNPADPEEWIKPLVETFDIFGNQPIEDHFIQNVLMKLLMPENNFEVLEFNKMQEANNAANQDTENQKIPMSTLIPRERLNKPLPPAIESILMKSLLPPVSNFKIFHFNEKSESQQQPQEEDMPPKVTFQTMKVKPMLPPIESLVKSLLPPNNMKIFQFNDNKQEQNSEEDMPKIMIQSIKLKLLPLPPQDDFGRREAPVPMMGNNNFEVIRLNESPEPSQEVEAPKMPLSNFNPFSIPIQDILMKTILPSGKNIEIVPLTPERPEEPQQMPQQMQRHMPQHMPQHLSQHMPQHMPQNMPQHIPQHMQHMPHPHHHQQFQDVDLGMSQQERFNPLPIPIQDLVMKTLMPPQPNAEAHYNGDDLQDQQQQQPQQNSDVEVTRIPVRTMKISPFSLPIPEALMKSMIPIGAFGEVSEVPHEPEDVQQQQQPEQEQSIQLQSQPEPQPQPQHLQPLPQPQQLQPQPQPLVHQQEQHEELPRPMAHSTKLNPVDVPWHTAEGPVRNDYGSEPVQN